MAQPKEIRKLAGGSGMRIVWPDGQTKEYSARFLRQQCHCAACRHEFTGAAILDPATVPADITILKADILGNYALSFQFSDGHSTGIYTFDFLQNAVPA